MPRFDDFIKIEPVISNAKDCRTHNKSIGKLQYIVNQTFPAKKKRPAQRMVLTAAKNTPKQV
jgi:hypothetical protein